MLGLAALAFGAGSCGGTASRGPTATTASPRALGPPPAEQVCGLLSDDEVNASLAVNGGDRPHRCHVRSEVMHLGHRG